MDGIAEVFSMLIPIVAIVSVFAFLGIAAWAKQRRSERDSYYRHELVKQMAEKGGDNDQVLSFMREEARVRQLVRKQGLIVGGLVTLAIGIGYMIAFQFVEDEIWAFGTIPTLVGLALLACGLWFGRGASRAAQ